jgi:hypothetical protein
MTRRTGAAIAALLLVVLAACGSSGGTADAVRGSIAEQATSTTAAPATTTTAAPGRTTSTTSRATTTTVRSATTTSTVAATALTKALTPPRSGTYRYDTTGATTFGVASQPFPAVTTLIVDPPTGTIQHSARNLQDPTGAGPLTEFTLDYRAQGVYLVALRITVGAAGTSQTLEFRPPSPVLLLATGAGPGSHTEADLPGQTGAKLVVDVLGAERVTVAGQGIDTLVMRAVVTLAPGDVTGSQSLTVNVDRTSRLWVRERSVLDASAGGGLFKLHSEYTANIQRLTP